MSKQNRLFKPLSVALVAVLAIGSLAGCSESETEKQARLYREYIAHGGNPIPQVHAPMAPAAPAQAPTTVVVQQDSGAGDVLLGAAAGAAVGALAVNMMSPRYQGESDYAYRERQKRWDAEYAARQARQRELDARRENDRLRAQMTQQQNDRLRAQAPAFQTAHPAAPQKTQNAAMFAQQPKEGQNFSRQQPMPAQPSIPAVQKPSGGGMFGSSGATSRSSSSSSSRSSSRSK
jgi:hypothetical protein